MKGIKLENKGPILISYLSQIILVIILLQVTGAVKWLTIIVALVTEVLIISSLIKEKKWDFQSWYAFFIFIIILLFLLAHSLSGTSDITTPLSVEIIVSLILGFFITVFSKESTDEEPPVKIVELEPSITIDRKLTPKKTAIKKRTSKKEKIVGVENGTTYHYPTCSYVKKTPKTKLVVYRTKRHAAANKLTPCKTCMK